MSTVTYTGDDGPPVTGEPVVDADADAIAAARTSLLAATTVAQTKARTVALFDLLTTTGDTP